MLTVSTLQTKPFCRWHALLLALSTCNAERACVMPTCHVDSRGNPVQGLYCLQTANPVPARANL